MTSRIRGKGKTLRLERTKAREEFGLRAGEMALWALLIISSFLPFLWLEDCQALEDYEFHWIREAHQLRAIVFQIDPQIPEYWERGKEAGPEVSATLAKALVSWQKELEGNPFYHLLLGETYFRQAEDRNAQDEWARASSSAGDDLFVHWLLLRDFCRSGKTDPARTEI